MDKLETPRGLSNLPIGQEVLIEKVLNEQKYEQDKRRGKKKTREDIQEKLHYYLNEKYDSFIGYNNFMNTLFKKKKVLRVSHGRDDRRKRKEGHPRREGSRHMAEAPSNENAPKVKCCGESDSSDGGRGGRPRTDRRSGDRRVVHPRDAHVKDEDEEIPLQRDQRGENNNNKSGCSKAFKRSSSPQRCTCDCHQCSSSLGAIDPSDRVDNISDERVDDVSDEQVDVVSSYSSASPAHCSDVSDISNLSPDAFCFEKQFKYIYDLYKQNDKNVYLFYNPPVCKCVNKPLKEKYYRSLSRKYPCLFNCTFEGEEGGGKTNRGEAPHTGEETQRGKEYQTKEEPPTGEESNDMKRLTYAEVASDAVEMKLYAKAFFELFLLQGGANNRNELAADMTQPGKALLGEEERDMLKRFFNKCLRRIMRRKSPTCENSSCCGLLYVPYSYIVVLLNRKVENLSYLCSNLKLPSSTDMYYNNKRNIVTICTKNSVHEFFCYYSLRENPYIKNILLYDIFFDGFIPFFKPLLNLKVKKNLDKVMNYVSYNKGCNLSVVFFWSGGSGAGGREEGVVEHEEESTSESSTTSNDNDNDNDNSDNEASKAMHLRVCKVININHPNEYKGMRSGHQKKDKVSADQQYFANLCNGSEVINNININMVVEKIVEIASRKESSLCEENCIFNRRNKMYGKKKNIQIYLCESINSFAFDRRPLFIKRREVTFSSFVHFQNIVKTYLGGSRNSLDALIGRRMEEDVFDMGVRKRNFLSSCHVEDENVAGGTTDVLVDGERSNVDLDHLFNETLFFFNDNSDLYTYEEYKRGRLQSVGRGGDQDNKPSAEQQHNAAGRMWMARSAAHAERENLWDSLCTKYAQNLFNIYVCSFLTKQNSCKMVASSIGAGGEKKGCKVDKMSYQERISFIKECYFHLFRFYKEKFRVSLKKEEEDILHRNNWASEDSLISLGADSTMPR
ncbi:Uncharacterized protein PCOAH_00054000 [Plasmodium coatneyi]|uniref:Uncharacterized protein n=1 Tax=Plasmodium coatneyi TaxID=208452 RepID=A0A1B1E6X4_9APIC|nr:Uncharacterized protein PCOAH_00054000 [Plasmodium coatneyi]ANQ10794.1 Uncharacterized protein PCOAH_00054000 [Plasmodium coatneyi]